MRTEIPKLDIASVVRLKKAVRVSEELIPKGQVGMVSDVLVSARSGETSYVVAFQKIEDYAMVAPKVLKPFVARGAAVIPLPKVPEGM